MSVPWWRTWAPDAALALAVVALGLFEISALPFDGGNGGGPLVLVVLAFAAAVGLSRHAPGVALALVWATCALQLGNGVQLIYVQASIAVVAFGTARWGSVPTLVLSGLSIPACALIGVLGVLTGEIYRGFGAAGGYEDWFARRTASATAGRSARSSSGWPCSVCRGWPGWPCASWRGPGTRRSSRWRPRRTPPAPSARPSRPARSPGSATSRRRWPATCTTWSATRWR